MGTGLSLNNSGAASFRASVAISSSRTNANDVCIERNVI